MPPIFSSYTISTKQNADGNKNILVIYKAINDHSAMWKTFLFNKKSHNFVE
jgi:hypothetical protein